MNISNGEIISLFLFPILFQLVHFKILGKFSESYGNSSVLQHCISSAIPGTSWKSQVLLWNTSVEKDSSIVLSLFSLIFWGLFGCIFRLWDMADACETKSKRNKISEMIFSRTRKDRGLEGQARGATEGPQACPARPWGGKASQCFREIYNLLICIFIGFKNRI